MKPYSIQAPEAIAKEYGGNKQKIAELVGIEEFPELVDHVLVEIRKRYKNSFSKNM